MAIYDVDGNVIATGGSEDCEAVAKEKLTGKVLIAIGDSYTVGMSNQLSALATKYGMIIDNRGKVSATISWRSSDSARRIYNIVDTVVSEYTSGVTISGSTYHADDVGIITFMGGANDGNGIANWLGTGIHETDKSTIYGSLHHIFSSLLKTFTKATLICVTQPSFYSLTTSGVSTDAQAQEIGFDDLAEVQGLDDVQYSNYCQAMKETAVKNSAWLYGIPVVDMFTEFPPVTNPENRTKYWNSDKLHLTADGYTYVANAVEKKMVSIVAQA